MCIQIQLAVLLTIPVSFVMADQTFSMDDINASLQMEYQSQLVFHSQNKAPPIKKAMVKQKQQARKIRQQQRTITQTTRQSVVKAPTPIPEADELFEAANQGNVNLIARLLSQGVNINSANREGETALHIAAARGRYSAVIYLINHGANIYAHTVKNWLPIHHATRFRHANIVNYLVQKGSSPYAKTSDGLSAIDMAKSTHDQQLMRILGAHK